MIVLDMHTGERVGHGYVIHYNDGAMSEPFIVSDAGEKLPQEWYNLQITDEVWNVVVPMRRQ